MTYFLITGLLSIPVVALGWEQRRRRRAAKRVLEVLRHLEDKYENLRNQHMAIAMTSQGKETEKMKEFIQKVLVIMKPDMDAFIHEAMLLEGSKSYLQPDQTNFPNVVSLINEWSIRGTKSSGMKGSEANSDFIARVSKAFQDAIGADIENRIMNWEAGNPLG